MEKGAGLRGAVIPSAAPVCHPERSEGSRSFFFPLSVIHIFLLASSWTQSEIRRYLSFRE